VKKTEVVDTLNRVVKQVGILNSEKEEAEAIEAEEGSRDSVAQSSPCQVFRFVAQCRSAVE
jgi:hypothetical protein